jgi:aspartokinase/homoserine dehydrogenase 1
MVGTGLIGKTLLDQLEKQRQILKDDASLSIRLIGLGNIDKMLFDMEGLPLSSSYRDLHKSKKAFDADAFIDFVKTSDLANSVFIDCTASEKIADRYQEVLNASVSIVTPNKIANTKSYKRYQGLRKTASEKNVKFLYETNVGAGLPVIRTIKNMISTGDKIHKIEGILSGTLSYIFNSFDGKKSFSQVVLEAKEKGYTEPDPRIDLGGIDAARKLLILTREIGYRFELADIRLESLLPKDAMGASSVQEFFKQLKKYDKDFELRWQEAKIEGKVLRHIARFENNRAEVLLTAVDNSHPFFSLNESDNIIAIYSDYYRSNPLVIKGPGAGANVTASGVLADVLQCSSYMG